VFRSSRAAGWDLVPQFYAERTLFVMMAGAAARRVLQDDLMGGETLLDNRQCVARRQVTHAMPVE
jgi:hypothetical protein